VAVAGFVTHLQRSDATDLRTTTIAWLEAQGHYGRELIADGDRWRNPEPADLDGVDVAVSLGGDGTMLRAVDLCSSAGIPVLGVNLGHLGYLTTVEPADLCAALVRFLAGDYAIDARMMLQVVVRHRQTQVVRFQRSALNDLVLTRPLGVLTVRAELSLRGGPFLTYAGDSLIVASPTGSTAYNLSARGPILAPDMRAMIVTPVAPHMLFDRSLVVRDDEEIRFAVTDSQPAELVIDGRSIGNLEPDEELVCTAGPRDALLMTFEDRDFHNLLKRKFNLFDR
jgi:NAD+ kinase